MRSRTLLAALLLALGLDGGSSGVAAQAVPSIAGRCLALKLEPGPRAESEGWVAHHPPDTVVLDSSVVRSRFGVMGFRLWPTLDGGVPESPARTPVWRSEGDSLEMTWNDGRVGERLVGRRSGSQFDGWAALVSDVGIGRRRTSARVSGRLVECPASLMRGLRPDRWADWVPDGYHLVPSPLIPDSLNETREDGRFTISITRVARDDFERELLWRAESLFPDRERIDQMVDTARGWNARGARAAGALPGPRWWWAEVDGVLLPYAATGAAVDYYVGRVRSLSSEPNPFRDAWFAFPHRASFSYEAEVIRTPESEDARRYEEVRIRLGWHFTCGPRCGVFFTHARTVRFDSDGRVVDVTGDGPPMYAIS